MNSYLRPLSFMCSVLVFSAPTESQWKEVTCPVTNVTCMDTFTDGRVVVGGAYGEVFASADSGLTWNSLKSASPSPQRVLQIASFGSNAWFVVTDSGIFRSTNQGASWTQKNDGITYLRYGWNMGMTIRQLPTADLLAGSAWSGLYRSTDGGDSWHQAMFGLQAVYSIAVDSSGVFIWALDIQGRYRLMKSTDNGLSWSILLDDPPFRDVSSQIFVGPNGLIVLSPRYVTADSGKTWSEIVPSYRPQNIRRHTNGTLFAVATGGPPRFLHSTDRGLTWGEAADFELRDFVLINGFIIATTSNGLMNTKEIAAEAVAPGVPRLLIPETNATGVLDSSLFVWSKCAGAEFYRLEVSPDTLFAFVNFLSRLTADTSTIWLDQLNDFQTYYWRVTAGNLCFTGAPSLTGTFTSGKITAVPQSGDHAPHRARLRECYPNPFNPATTITFELPSPEQVSLRIFDFLGREIATLVSGQCPAGTQSIQWNASRLPSGVYFCRLQSGNYTETKKLILQK